MDPLIAARQRSLELALDSMPHASEEHVLKRADAFARFIISGKTEATK